MSSCLDFRRRLYVDPYARDAALLQHRDECERCARWHERHLRHETATRKAAGVPVPAGLAPRILLGQAHLRAQGRRAVLRRGAMLAASFVLGALATALVMRTQPPSRLGDDVLRHVEDLAYVLDQETSVERTAVTALFGWIGADLSADLGEVRFANLCTLRGQAVAHLVLAGAAGPVTVLVMPDEAVDARIRIERASRRGRVVPYREGALVLLGEEGEPLDPVESRVRSALKWRRPAPGSA